MKFLKFPLLLLAVTPLFFTSCDDEGDVDDPISIREVDAFTSTNTDGEILTFDFSDLDDDPNVTNKRNTVAYADADGIYYNDFKDLLIQVSRTDNKVYVYEDFKDAEAGAAVTPDFESEEGLFSNARGITFGRDRIIVAQDGNDANNNVNKLVVFNLDDKRPVLRNTFTVDINLWGIFYDDNDLYVISDNTSDVAIYKDFFDNETDGDLTPTMTVTIEGLVRTHGLTFSDADDELMILTDVGDAASDSDGQVIFIRDFDDKSEAAGDGGTIALADQIVIRGEGTFLGNPVDVDYDQLTERIFVSERKTDGGRLLVFDRPETSGNPAPIYNTTVPGISSLALDLGL